MTQRFDYEHGIWDDRLYTVIEYGKPAPDNMLAHCRDRETAELFVAALRDKSYGAPVGRFEPDLGTVTPPWFMK